MARYERSGSCRKRKAWNILNILSWCPHSKTRTPQKVVIGCDYGFERGVMLNKTHTSFVTTTLEGPFSAVLKPMFASNLN